MRIVYFGSPEAAVEPLRALHSTGHSVELVVTREDKRRGRGGGLSPTPVKAAAMELGLAVGHDPSAVLDMDVDLGVVVAFGRIISPDLLAHVSMINIHFSLLPRWRGAAPVERAILAGDAMTGVSIMAVEEGLDTGAVFARCEVPIEDSVTSDELRGRLTDAGTKLLIDTLGRGLGDPEVQNPDEVTYAEKITPADRHIDWEASATQVLRKVRIGGAWTTFRGRRFVVREAGMPSGDEPAIQIQPGRAGEFIEDDVVATGEGVIRLRMVQSEGKSAMPASAWARGSRPIGERLGK